MGILIERGRLTTWLIETSMEFSLKNFYFKDYNKLLLYNMYKFLCVTTSFHVYHRYSYIRRLSVNVSCIKWFLGRRYETLSSGPIVSPVWRVSDEWPVTNLRYPCEYL